MELYLQEETKAPKWLQAFREKAHPVNELITAANLDSPQRLYCTNLSWEHAIEDNKVSKESSLWSVTLLPYGKRTSTFFGCLDLSEPDTMD